MHSNDLRLLVGLGNPGSKYKNTRHNIGFMVLERLAQQKSANFRDSKKLLGQITEIGLGENIQRLLLPKTFMNESGRSIQAAIKWFDLEVNQILILVDDMDLQLGQLRLRSKGGAGGHKGLQSAISHLRTEEFCRLRVGIGPPSLNQEDRREKTVKHVLGEFSSGENQLLEEVIEKAVLSIHLIKELGIEKASNQINSFHHSLNT